MRSRSARSRCLLDLAADEAADMCILHDRRLERREDLVRLDLLLTGTVRLPNGFAKCASMLILLRQ
jgi:hypothetical protein